VKATLPPAHRTQEGRHDGVEENARIEHDKTQARVMTTVPKDERESVQ
jgi:hypothetical protein